MLAKYSPSGIVDGRFFVWAPVVLPAAAALGAVYQLLIHFIPLIFIDLAICCGLGLVTGSFVGVLSRMAHCRNQLASAALGLAAALVGVAVGHFVEYALNTGGSVGFWDYIEARANVGWNVGKFGSSSSSTPPISGWVSYVVWGVEAALVFWMAAMSAYWGTSRPYCEQCGAWADFEMVRASVVDPPRGVLETVKGATGVEGLVPSGSSEGAVPAMGEGKAEEAEAVSATGGVPTAGSTLRYTVTSCSECKTFHTLRVEHVLGRVNGRKTGTETRLLHEGVLLTSEEVAELAKLPGAVTRRAEIGGAEVGRDGPIGWPTA